MTILLPFFDDSLLFTALKIYEKFIKIQMYIVLVHVFENNNLLSDRQISILNDSYVIHKKTIKEFYDAKYLSMFDIVITTRLPGKQFKKSLIKNADKYFINHRPYFLSMTSGIDFFPETGIKNRSEYDGICISDLRSINNFKSIFSENQNIFKYHPLFELNKNCEKIYKNINYVYFFAQSIVPFSLQDRINIIQLLIEMCEHFPEKKFLIKLRNLKNENLNHKHIEMFSYIDIVKLISSSKKIPSNLDFSYENMDAVLHKADFCFTCNSTAAIESICAGIPTAIYLDYGNVPEFSFLKKEAEFFFKNSNLIYTKEDLLNLKIKSPNQDWLSKVFCTNSSIFDIKKQINFFHKNYIFDPKFFQKNDSAIHFLNIASKYREKGEFINAVINYKKALNINPHSKSAKNFLKKHKIKIFFYKLLNIFFWYRKTSAD